MRHMRRTAVLAVTLAICLAQWANAQAVKQLPADTLVLLKVTNLKQTSDKVNKLLNTLGVAQLAGIQDPLEMVKAEMGITKGLKEDGEMVFAYIDPKSTGVDEDESMVILLPVSDYQAFLGNFGEVKTEGAVSEGKIKNDPAFIAQWGEYAALSPIKAMIATAPASALVIAEALGGDMTKSDAIVYANIEKLRPLLMPQIEKAKSEGIAEMERELAGNEQQKKFAPVAKAAATQGFGAIEAFFRDSNAAAISINLSDEGIALNVIANFVPGTYLGKTVASVKGTDEALVKGLPAGEYLLYGGMTMDSDAAGQVLVDFAGPIVKAFADAQPEQAGQADKLMAASLQYLKAAKRSSFGLVAPAGQLGQEAILQMVQVTTGDPAAIKDSVKTMAEIQGQLFGQMQQGTMTYTEGAKTVGGVAFDQATVKLDTTPPAAAANETPEQAQARQRATRAAAQMQQAMAMIYGPGGMNQYNAVVGDKFIVGSGVTDELLGKLVDSAKADTDLLATKAYVQPVTRALPANRCAVVYIPLDQWAKTGTTYAGMMGFPVQLQLPPDLPPIGVAVTTQGPQLRIESFIPVDLLQSLIAAGMQAAGGAGAAGGGL